MIKNYDFYCPQCGKKAETVTPAFFRSYSRARLDLVIFCCDTCRTIYVDKPTIRRMISVWRKDNPQTIKITFENQCREFYKELEKMLNEYWIPIGRFRKARFLRVLK